MYRIFRHIGKAAAEEAIFYEEVTPAARLRAVQRTKKKTQEKPWAF